MFFKKKADPIPPMEVSELILLNDRLTDMIVSWITREVGEGIEEGSKIMEILVFNFKIFYEDSEEATNLRKFLVTPSTPGEKIEYLFSRLQDLYITIRMMFPGYFIDSIQSRHLATLKQLGYSVDEEIAERLNKIGASIKIIK